MPETGVQPAQIKLSLSEFERDEQEALRQKGLFDHSRPRVYWEHWAIGLIFAVALINGVYVALQL